MIIKYHNETKHKKYQYARSPGYMDWENQPVPFRFYKNADIIQLPRNHTENNTTFESLYHPENRTPKPFSLNTVSYFLAMSLGLSTWKQYGESTWPLRMNPSSGNLHPEELYLISEQSLLNKNCSGFYLTHYNPYLHGLEILSEQKENLPGNKKPPSGFGLILRSIPWREAWKYGERAFRYCCLDTGHALSALSYSAALSGWHIDLIQEINDDTCDSFFSTIHRETHETEKEFSDCLLWVNNGFSTSSDIQGFINQLNFIPGSCIPNRLSQDHLHWDVIYKAISDSKYTSGITDHPLEKDKCRNTGLSDMTAEHVIKKRRSGQRYDFKKSAMGWDVFLNILNKLVSDTAIPYSIRPCSPSIHPVFFIHSVENINPGLYLLLRNSDDLTSLKQSFSQEFLWESPVENKMLYILREGNFRKVAEQISCNQSIAGNGSFSVAMISRFSEQVTHNPWMYKRLFWEAGILGHILYLEAEANRFRGTGIGCFLDDEMHNLLGLKDDTWQDLYHFAVGHPIRDTRIISKPAYQHLEQRS